MARLENKTAIITGAARGMGEAKAILFAREGAKVMATDIQVDNMNEWVTKAKKEGLTIEYMQHDVTSENDWKKVIDKTIELFGKIDILINNAGIYPPFLTTESTTLENWNHVHEVNLTSVFLGTKAVLPYMKKNGKGSIVNISSISGIVGGWGAAYTSSKGAIRLLTKDHAVEFAPFNIRVNSIHPGGVVTPMSEPLIPIDPVEKAQFMKNLCPQGRMAEPIEIAYGALFLASDEASFVTGTELVMDGGMTAR